MAQVGLLYDATVLDHKTPALHPERLERIQSIYTVLESTGLLSRLVRLPVIPATRQQLERVHHPQYLDAVEAMVKNGGGVLDTGETVASAGTWRAVVTAAGSAISGVNAVMTQAVDAAFAVIRPPGHHATPTSAMGFCIVNHAAVAAAHAIAEYGLSRVLIVDCDVHHGNGTQDAFYDDPRVLFFSTHQNPAYPFTGHINEVGIGEGAGFTVNVPLPVDVDDDGFCEAFRSILRPVADRYRPQLVILSAGYDAHWRNSEYVTAISERMTVRGLGRLSRIVQEIADAHSPGKLVGILEGGYDLESLAYGVCATIRRWLGDDEVDDPIGPPPGAVAPPDLTVLLTAAKEIHNL